jgi:hypothetical protein
MTRSKMSSVILNSRGRLCRTKKLRLWVYGETTPRTLPHFPCSCRRLFARVISARVAAILTPLFFVAIGLPSIVEQGEASGVDFDTDVAGAEGYTLEWFRGLLGLLVRRSTSIRYMSFT